MRRHSYKALAAAGMMAVSMVLFTGAVSGADGELIQEPVQEFAEVLQDAAEDLSLDEEMPGQEMTVSDGEVSLYEEPEDAELILDEVISEDEMAEDASDDAQVLFADDDTSGFILTVVSEDTDKGRIDTSPDFGYPVYLETEADGNLPVWITAVGKTGYVFDHWEMDGETLKSSSNEIYGNDLEITKDCTLKAFFRETGVTTYIFRASEHGKLLAGSPWKVSDTEVIYKAAKEYDEFTPDMEFSITAQNVAGSGYHFAYWESGGVKKAYNKFGYYDFDWYEFPYKEGVSEVIYEAVYEKDYDAEVLVRPNVYTYGKIALESRNGHQGYIAGDPEHEMTLNVEPGTGHLFGVWEKEAEPSEILDMLCAVPSPGFVFSHWEINGEKVSESSEYPDFYTTFDLGPAFTEDSVLTAVFEPDPECQDDMFNVTFAAQGDGEVLIHGRDRAKSYTLQVYRPKPTKPEFVTTTNPEGSPWHFVKWHNPADEEGAYPDLDIIDFYYPDEGDLTITAEYAKDSYTVTFTSEDPTKGTVWTYPMTDDPIVVNTQSGGTLPPSTQISAVGNPGYLFDHWEMNGERIDYSNRVIGYNSLTFTDDCTLTACFRETDTTKYIFRAPEYGKLQAGSPWSVSDTEVIYTAAKQYDEFTPDMEFIIISETVEGSGYHFKYWECNGKKIFVKHDQDRWYDFDWYELPYKEGVREVVYEAVYEKDYDAEVLVRPNVYSYGELQLYKRYNNHSYVEDGMTQDEMTIKVQPDSGLLFGIHEHSDLEPQIKNYLMPVPSPGFVFSHWEINGEKVSEVEMYPDFDFLTGDAGPVFTEDSVLTAVFEPDPECLDDMVNLTFEAQGDGEVFIHGRDRAKTYTMKMYYPNPTFPRFVDTKSPEGSPWHFVKWHNPADEEGFYEDPRIIDFYKPETKSDFTITAEYLRDPEEEKPSSDPSDPNSGIEDTISGSAGGTQEEDKDSLAALEKQIYALTGDEAPAGADFGTLRLRAVSAKKKSIKLKWRTLSGAKGYMLYGAARGQKFQKIGFVSGNTYTVKGLNKGKYYKYMVAAVTGSENNDKVLAYSKAVHEATSGGKVSNPKKVKAAKKKLKLKTGKSRKNRGKIIKPAGKRVRTLRKICYESSDPNVATVNAKGKIKAVGKGKCKIFVYAQNGKYVAVNVNVK